MPGAAIGDAAGGKFFAEKFLQLADREAHDWTSAHFEVRAMHSWDKRIFIAAAVLAGCQAQIDGPGTTSGQGDGSVATPPGANGTGGGPGGVGGPGAGATGNPSVCAPGVPGTSQLPRLTRTQYDNTIRDLLNLQTQPSSMLAPDTVGSVDQRAWDGYKLAAETLSAAALTDKGARARVIPCTPSGDGAACAKQLISELGARAFRRPLTAEEQTRFEAIYADRAALTATGSFDEAAQLLIELFLKSPSFLTRAEIAEVPEGQYFALNGYEIASRLSYMLWSSMPDDALFAAARDGQLATSEAILAQARRMLSDPKAHSMVSAFHTDYAHMGPGTRWQGYTRDPALYPAFSDALVPLLSQETERFFDYMVFERNGTFQDLLTSPVAFVNASLAPLYGLDAAGYGADLTPVELDPATRPGIFTRAGFLAANSLFNRSSAILRGAFIQKQVLCRDIGAPPPGAESTPQPTEGLATNRARTDAQTSGAACAGCHHTLINPTGFTLEAFDAVGAYQTAEKDTGAAIDTSATVVIGAASMDVKGPGELMQAIAKSPEAQHCYAQKWVQYAYQRQINPADACTVENMTTKLTQGGYTVADLITDLTQSQSFRLRALGTEVAP
jgi:hypothetical protein